MTGSMASSLQSIWRHCGVNCKIQPMGAHLATTNSICYKAIVENISAQYALIFSIASQCFHLCTKIQKHFMICAGWTDPLLQQNVSMGFAWPANDTASSVLGKPTVQLSWRDSPLIFQYSISTGRSRGREPFDVRFSQRYFLFSKAMCCGLLCTTLSSFSYFAGHQHHLESRLWLHAVPSICNFFKYTPGFSKDLQEYQDAGPQASCPAISPEILSRLWHLMSRALWLLTPLRPCLTAPSPSKGVQED